MVVGIKFLVKAQPSPLPSWLKPPILRITIDFGCDIVVHSSSKYTTGQGLAIGGVIVEGKSAKSKIVDNPRYSHFNEPDMSYHGLYIVKHQITHSR